MTSKLSILQSALDNSRANVTTERQSRERPAPKSRQSNRVGRVNIAAWLHPDFKTGLRLTQARRGGSIQDILEEALNDVFAKYDVPEVVEPRRST